MMAPKVTACTVEGAFDEGMVRAVLELYRVGLIDGYRGQTKRQNIYGYLINVLRMNGEDANFWLDKHGVK